jgi:hypothetical protein
MTHRLTNLHMLVLACVFLWEATSALQVAAVLGLEIEDVLPLWQDLEAAGFITPVAGCA